LAFETERAASEDGGGFDARVDATGVVGGGRGGDPAVGVAAVADLVGVDAVVEEAG
jgi:hypothetical protein